LAWGLGLRIVHEWNLEAAVAAGTWMEEKAGSKKGGRSGSNSVRPSFPTVRPGMLI
jgi:hypothetical protein